MEYRSEQSVLDDYVVRRYGPDPLADSPSVPTSACPYCGTAFEAALKRTRKCPECKSKIIVRTISGEKVSLTEDEADSHDERKQLLAQHRAALMRVQNIGVGATRFVETLDALGSGYAPRDASWRIFNEALIAAGQRDDIHGMKMAYLGQAIQLKDEGSDFSMILGLSREAEALEIWSSDHDPSRSYGLEIHSCGCDACSVDAGRRIPWSELGRGQVGIVGPLPHAGCERGFCTCSYFAWGKSLEEMLDEWV